MPIIRLTLILGVIASIVLFAAYLLTRNSRYLYYLKQLLIYNGWFYLILALLYLVSRVIRF